MATRETRDCEPVWDCVLPARPIGGFHVVPLECMRDLCAEGAAMQHCVVSYEDQCVEGYYRVYSLRQSPQGERIATIGLLFLEGRWRLHEVQGKCNQEVSTAVHRVAERWAKLYNRVDRMRRG